MAPATATFSVTATGTPTPTYQWHRNGTDLSGATLASYTTGPTVHGDDGALFTVTVQNSAGTVTSGTATLTVQSPTPTLTGFSPASGSVGMGVILTGTGLMDVQSVSFNGTPASSFNSLSATSLQAFVPIGATTGPITVVTLGGTVVTSANFNLISAPVISVEPQGQTVTAPATATFSVTATGSPTPTYQWQRDGSPINGATLASYTTGATAHADNGARYRVVVSNSVGIVTSDYATLTVQSPSPTLTGISPTSASVGMGVTLTGTGLVDVESVSFNGTPATNFTSLSATSLHALVPAAATTGPITVVTLGGTAVTSTNFTLVAPSALDLSIDGMYITQATQTYLGAVPLVAGRDGYLRVFVKANAANSATPVVRARIYNGSTLVWSTSMSAAGASVPLVKDEATLASSWNTVVPGAYLQSGYSLVADVDPDGLISEADKTNNTFLSSLNVISAPIFRATLVPVVQQGLTGNVTTSNLSQWTDRFYRMYPIKDMDVALHAAYTTSQNLNADSGAASGGAWDTLLNEIEAKRVAEGKSTTRYYYGCVKVSYANGVAGLGYVGSAADTNGRSAIGWDKSTGYSDGGLFPEIYAHEVGHNMGREHVNCGGPSDYDPSYPYDPNTIGVYGFDVTNLILKAPAAYQDIMSYCSPLWVSDYTYRGIQAFRAASSMGVVASDPASGEPCLLVWGRIQNGTVVLEPTFHLTTVPALPAAGDWTLEGLDASGNLLLARGFAPAEVADTKEPGTRHFAMALPMTEAVLASLKTLRVSRSGQVLASHEAVTGAAPLASSPTLRRVDAGTVHLAWDVTQHSVALVRDVNTGEVLSFARGGEVEVQSGAKSLEVILSSGLRHRRLMVPVEE